MPDLPEYRIRVRDRRATRQFSIENRIMDEWYPIIERIGFTLYALYVRMANEKAGERSWPGYTTITQHLHVSPGSVSNYNNLLVWCSLIHIVPGNRRRPNDYYILTVPTVTAGLLELDICAITVSVASNKVSSVTATVNLPVLAPAATLIWASAATAV